jgi:hypothetical protein
MPACLPMPGEGGRSAGGRIVTNASNVIVETGYLLVTQVASVKFKFYLDMDSTAIVWQCGLVIWRPKHNEPDLSHQKQLVRLS